MSRSTPLQNLPNNSQLQNAYDEKENQLVKEILQEIDTGSNNQQQQMPPPQPQPQMPSPQPQAQPQQMPEESQMNSHEVEAHMHEQQLMHDQMLDNMNMDHSMHMSFTDKILHYAKQPLIVALIAVIVSIPALSNMIDGFIKSKPALVGYATILVLLVKGILAGGLYFGINKSI